MGTNFYTRNGVHVGKRSAAGLFCFTCRSSEFLQIDAAVEVARCLGCEAVWQRTDVLLPSAAVELGFAAPDYSAPPQGIASAINWYWQVGAHGLGETVDEVRCWLRRYTLLIDEYGRRMPMAEFWRMLAWAAREDSSDREFS